VNAGEVRSPCSCEDVSHSDYGVVADDEPLIRVLTDRHFNKSGKLRPAAFPISDVRDRGLSLVRSRYVDHPELSAIASNIVDLSNAAEARGALVGRAGDVRAESDVQGLRALCVKDDPVPADDRVRANPAHAITMATSSLPDEDVQELRDRLLTIFGDAVPLGDALMPAAKDDGTG
jgi:hypothetical protein